MLKNKNIILGVTGSIAAYKVAYLTRLLIKEGCNVQIIMTEYSKEFITPLTLSTLSQRSILCNFFDKNNGLWSSHVELGLWADYYIIAPLSANTLAKMANGICDNLLLAVYLACRCPVLFAPAMDMDMYKHPSTQKNVKTLQSYNNILIEPDNGELASGLEGVGRMAEPENIIKFLQTLITN